MTVTSITPSQNNISETKNDDKRDVEKIFQEFGIEYFKENNNSNLDFDDFYNHIKDDYEDYRKKPGDEELKNELLCAIFSYKDLLKQEIDLVKKKHSENSDIFNQLFHSLKPLFINYFNKPSLDVFERSTGYNQIKMIFLHSDPSTIDSILHSIQLSKSKQSRFQSDFKYQFYCHVIINADNEMLEYILKNDLWKDVDLLKIMRANRSGGGSIIALVTEKYNKRLLEKIKEYENFIEQIPQKYKTQFFEENYNAESSDSMIKPFYDPFIHLFIKHSSKDEVKKHSSFYLKNKCVQCFRELYPNDEEWFSIDFLTKHLIAMHDNWILTSDKSDGILDSKENFYDKFNRIWKEKIKNCNKDESIPYNEILEIVNLFMMGPEKTHSYQSIKEKSLDIDSIPKELKTTFQEIAVINQDFDLLKKFVPNDEWGAKFYKKFLPYTFAKNFDSFNMWGNEEKFNANGSFIFFKKLLQESIDNNEFDEFEDDFNAIKDEINELNSSSKLNFNSTCFRSNRTNLLFYRDGGHPLGYKDLQTYISKIDRVLQNHKNSDKYQKKQVKEQCSSPTTPNENSVHENNQNNQKNNLQLNQSPINYTPSFARKFNAWSETTVEYITFSDKNNLEGLYKLCYMTNFLNLPAKAIRAIGVVVNISIAVVEFFTAIALIFTPAFFLGEDQKINKSFNVKNHLKNSLSCTTFSIMDLMGVIFTPSLGGYNKWVKGYLSPSL